MATLKAKISPRFADISQYWGGVFAINLHIIVLITLKIGSFSTVLTPLVNTFTFINSV